MRTVVKPKGEDRHCVISQSRIMDLLLLAGWAFELEAGQRQTAQSATEAALEGWIEAGLGFRLDPARSRLFDPVEVVNYLKWAGLTGQDPFWSERYVKTGRRLVETFRQNSTSGLQGTSRSEKRFYMEVQRTFDLTPFSKGAITRLRQAGALSPTNLLITIVALVV